MMTRVSLRIQTFVLLAAGFLAVPVTLRAAESAKATAAFDVTQKLHGIAFHVTSPNSAEKNTVTLTPSGLSAVNRAETVEAKGIVTGADIGDADADGSPEIYVYLRGTGPGAPGALVAFSANNKKSMSQITVPELSATEAKGYRGGDQFMLVENTIARRFALHGADGKPTGKMRQIQYKLKKGEASWVLKADRVVEF